MRRDFVALAAAALPALVAIGCGGDGDEAVARRSMAPAARPAQDAADGNHPPVVERVSLVPRDPRPGERVQAVAEVSDPDGDAVRLSYEWSLDGRPLQVRGDAFEGRAEKGNALEVRVVASDGFAKSAASTARARFGNQPPILQGLSYTGASKLVPGDPLVVEPVASDPDGDELEFEYTWFVNGEEVEDVEGASFPTSKVRRGDRVRVRVVADDGTDESAPLEGVELVAENSPARFKGVPDATRDGDTFRWAFEAEDPDGDTRLRFRLVEAPSGMTIDPVLGTASWRPGPSQAGVHPIEVAVADAYGDGASIRFQITVSQGAREESAAPPAASAEE